MLQKRSSGLLLHITSLPSAHGIGDLGPEAYRFADQLAEAKQSYWQILPLSPIEEGLGNSPYSSASAFAGNILLISLERLVNEGFLDAADIAKPPKFPKGKADYAAARQYKEPLLDQAFERFSGGSMDRHAYGAFC
ncbi:MAG: 4-alpha-glucanotransferase, partial [Cytophagales bacterium]|nr:4-alpha-glucanotransferase [Cytophagales bacterium]